ncbi:MAG: FAD-dependent oxidoreductase [Planctomycetes bacterium]|nr:FAD-dependent oxidoreductase [Planctomycetota bacterium]
MRLIKRAPREQKKGRKVAVIGAGPAGLYAAGWLASEGYTVELIDMLPEPGGLLACGIPDLRMEKVNLREAVGELRGLGVAFRLGTKVGENVELEELIEGHDATLIATGAWQSRKLNVDGEGLAGVYSALEYLVDYTLARHSHDGEPPALSGGIVLVVGGGLSAVDACYVAREAGAAQVVWYYRRGEEQAPAREAEPEAFRLLTEQVDFHPLTQPVSFIGAGGKLTAVKAVRMRLGSKDASGRPRPIPIEGSEFERRIDYALVAAGEIATAPPGAVECGIEVADETALRTKGVVITNEVTIPVESSESGGPLQYVSIPRERAVRAKGSTSPRAAIKVDGRYRTTRRGVFAAGNVIDGPTQAGFAIVEGVMAAVAIKDYLETDQWPAEPYGGVYEWQELLFG